MKSNKIFILAIFLIIGFLASSHGKPFANDDQMVRAANQSVSPSHHNSSLIDKPKYEAVPKILTEETKAAMISTESPIENKTQQQEHSKILTDDTTKAAMISTESPIENKTQQQEQSKATNSSSNVSGVEFLLVALNFFLVFHFK